jgi:hypothetical protein
MPKRKRDKPIETLRLTHPSDEAITQVLSAMFNRPIPPKEPEVPAEDPAAGKPKP